MPRRCAGRDPRRQPVSASRSPGQRDRALDPAWQADANEEHLYLLDGQGKLQGERLIKASETRGTQSWPLLPGAASYRLEIPGYSFRNYRVEHDEHTVALFEPAKVHFSAQTQNGDELYFKVAPGNRRCWPASFMAGSTRCRRNAWAMISH